MRRLIIVKKGGEKIEIPNITMCQALEKVRVHFEENDKQGLATIEHMPKTPKHPHKICSEVEKQTEKHPIRYTLLKLANF